MELPLRLARRDTPPAAADAFLLIADGFDQLAATCLWLGGEALPVVHPVRGGFVLVPPEGTSRPVPGAVRLRRVTGDLFTPADADLLPRLLPDEIASLTAERGLVVLPGGEVLAFDPARPLRVDQWLAPARVRRSAWGPFPPRPDRADRLTVIERPADPAAAVEILTSGRPDGADPLPGAGEGDAGSIPEDARPQSGSPLARLAAGAQLGAGRFLAWLARAARAPGLAKLGADLARRAMERVPRLTEKVLGAQEAALREVLRQLQSGDVEKALRRAPIAAPDPSAPSRIDSGADLGTRDPRYSLRDLLGAGSGPGVGWLGGGDVWARLADEYRRLAREAAARGDYRRAAYLHGVLLRDLRGAANVLMAGGFYRDAAILFRDKLRDEPAAAAAFEQAGDYDEAVRLYDKLGRYEPAGDLLRRIGDEDRAAGYFQRAAVALHERGHPLAAGDLIRRKLGDSVGATGYYLWGWEADSAESLPCGERLLDQYLLTESWADVDRLVATAAVRFVPPRARDAGRFFNYLLSLGPDFLPADRRADLADRARLLFAAHLRALADVPRLAEKTAGDLYGGTAPWPAPVVRDAAFAARRAGRPATAWPGHEPPVRLADGAVTAAVAARDTGDIVVATTSAVVCWRAGSGLVLPVLATGERTVLGLSTDPSGRVVYVLYEDGEDTVLRCFASTGPGSFASMGQKLIPVPADGRDGLYLQPSAGTAGGEPVVTLTIPPVRISYRTLYLLDEPPRGFLFEGRVVTHLLARAADCAWDWDDLFVRCLTGGGPSATGRWVANWTPAVPPDSPLVTAAVDWIAPASRVLEVAGVDREGNLYWSEFNGRGFEAGQSRTATVPHPDGFRAVCLVAPGTVMAATGRNEVSRFRVSGTELRRTSGPVTVSTPARVVFLARRPRANGVVAVTEDGSAVTIPGL
jgi:tetratricopeptide (TPR) repeat protein